MIPCAHTMGTPELDVFRAVEVFASAGFSATEIICSSEYQCAVDTGWNSGSRKRLLQHLKKLNMTTACLTPYLKTINSFDPVARSRCMEEGKEVVRLSHDLECRGIRMLAGVDVLPENETSALSLLAEAIGELAQFAGQYGVELWVENHMNSLATSAENTVRIMEMVQQPNVGILYDQANLIQMGAEPAMEALRKQAPYIRHVHVKDVVWSTVREAKLLGEGQVDWPEIIKGLSDVGYAGYLCHEYERRWVPDLPPAEVGMAHGCSYLTQLIHTTKSHT